MPGCTLGMYLLSWPLTWPGKCPHSSVCQQPIRSQHGSQAVNQKPAWITGSQWEASMRLNELLKGEWLQRWSKVNTSLAAQTRNPWQGSSDISQKYTSIHPPHAMTGTEPPLKYFMQFFSLNQVKGSTIIYVWSRSLADVRSEVRQ